MGLGAGFTGIGMVGSCTTTAGKLVGVRRSACVYRASISVGGCSQKGVSLQGASIHCQLLYLISFYPVSRVVRFRYHLSFPLAAIA